MEAVAKGDKELLEAITVKLTEAGMFDKARRFVRSNVLGNARTAIQLAKHDDLAQSHKDIEDAHGEPNTASGRHERAAGRTQKAWNKAHLGEEGGRWVYDNAGNMREIPASQAAATRKANLDRMKAASNPFDDDEYGNHQKRQPDEYGNVFNEEETLDEVKSGEIANHPWIARRAKIKGTNEVGEVIRLCREHTFSQMVPFITMVWIKLDSGETKEVRQKNVLISKKTPGMDESNDLDAEYHKTKPGRKEGKPYDYGLMQHRPEIASEPNSRKWQQDDLTNDRITAAWAKTLGRSVKEETRERSVSFSDGARVRLKDEYSDEPGNEIFTVSQCDPERKKCWIGDKQGRGWFVHFDQLVKASAKPKSRFNQATRDFNKSKMSEAGADPRPESNFSPEDIKALEKITDVPTLKARCMELISTSSQHQMKPEKVSWFSRNLEQKNSRLAIIKMMYDLLLAGEGHQVIGNKYGMGKNSYRQTFGEDASGGASCAGAIASGPAGNLFAQPQKRVKETKVKKKKSKIGEGIGMAESQLNELKPKIIPRTLAGGKLNPNHPANADAIAKEKEAIYQRKEQQRAARAAKAAAKLAPGYKPPPKKYKGYTLDAIYQKAQDAIGNSFPDGDPGDHLYPWLEKRGLDMDIVNRAFRKFDKTDFYGALAQYWDDTQADQLYDVEIMKKQGHNFSRVSDNSPFYDIDKAGNVTPRPNPWKPTR
jgi:hypothetical protein